MWKKLVHNPHSSSYTPRNATLLRFLECMNWHVQQSGALLRFTVTYVSLTTLKRSGIAMPTSTGLLPMKTWIDWPVWTFTNFIISWTFMNFKNFILKFLNFTTMGHSRHGRGLSWFAGTLQCQTVSQRFACGKQYLWAGTALRHIPAPLYPLITTLVNVIHT